MMQPLGKSSMKFIEELSYKRCMRRPIPEHPCCDRTHSLSHGLEFPQTEGAPALWSSMGCSSHAEGRRHREPVPQDTPYVRLLEKKNLLGVSQELEKMNSQLKNNNKTSKT